MDDRMTRFRAALISIVCALLVLGGLPPAPIHAATVWRQNLYQSAGFMYQDPYYTACTAASAMMMLNFTALAGTGGSGFAWTVNRTSGSAGSTLNLGSVLAFERRYDTLALRAAGSDAHGWRNALNYYGWGMAAMTDPNRRVYEDRAYGSFDAALKQSVRAIARYHMPVGMVGWAGQHAQVITGYVVTGDDPANSWNFTVNGIYLSDPLRKDWVVNKYLTRAQLKFGRTRFRFQAYRQIDSPYDDPFTPGFIRSSVRSRSSEWYGRWVIIAPIRASLPADPNATPTPTPNPTPSGDPSAAPLADPSASSTPDPSPSYAPDPSPSPTPNLVSTQAPTLDPTATPAATPPAAPSDSPSGASTAPGG
jgi:cell division septation protein DedD